MNLAVFASLLMITSCATVVKKIGKPSRYAPVNYQETGIVKYLNAGGDAVIEMRKEDAFKEMHNACNGSYEIIREGNQTQFQSSYSSMDTNYWMMEFKCKPVAASN